MQSPPWQSTQAFGSPTSEEPWWRRGAVYQVYPRSFADSDGDGVGDLDGIRSRLDHVASLGVAAIWLSPVFPSPMADFGYDVSDYCDIDPVFGSLEGFDGLVAEAHARGIRVVLDWVANHTSDQHPWFVASRSSREDPKRDWYVWADPGPGGGPPNDWTSAFGAVGPAWTLDQGTGQYYLHSFAPQQPDLNWDNPEVEAAMHETVRFWLGRGVDGLRLDAIIKIAKDPLLRDNAGASRPHHEDWETIEERLRRLRAVLEEFPERMMVGELWAEGLGRFVSFLRGDGMHLAHNFEFVDLPWDAGRYRAFIDDVAAAAKGQPATWPCWFLENHDLPRVASRFDQDGLGAARARAVLLMLHTLRGTPFLYQGQELGLPDASIPPERVVDVDGRDPERAPIPWQRPSRVGPGAGFTTGEPWLPLVEDAERLCVEAQEADPGSCLHLTRRIGALRRDEPALRTGTQRTVNAGPGVLAWLREDADTRFLVAMSFAGTPVPLGLPRGAVKGVVVLETAVPGSGLRDTAAPDRDAPDTAAATTVAASPVPEGKATPEDLGGLVLPPGGAVLIRLEPQDP